MTTKERTIEKARLASEALAHAVHILNGHSSALYKDAEAALDSARAYADDAAVLAVVDRREKEEA